MKPRAFRGLLRHGLFEAMRLRHCSPVQLGVREAASQLLNHYGTRVVVRESEDGAQGAFWTEQGIVIDLPPDLDPDERAEEIIAGVGWMVIGHYLPDTLEDAALLDRAVAVFRDAYLAGGTSILAPLRIVDPETGDLVMEIRAGADGAEIRLQDPNGELVPWRWNSGGAYGVP